MNEKEVKHYLGKTVKLFLKNKFVYNGNVLNVNNGSIKLLDKFKEEVTIDISEIILIKTDGGKSK